MGIMPLDYDTRTWWSADPEHGIGMRPCGHLDDTVRVRVQGPAVQVIAAECRVSLSWLTCCCTASYAEVSHTCQHT